jgi:putative hydrolase of the HAD superfamily
MARRYRRIVFDLDDTLLDTAGRLVPPAAREACNAMIRAGLKVDLDAALKERAAFIRREPRGNVYRHLVDTYGVRDGIRPEEVVNVGSRAFHEREVEHDIALFPGAMETLQHLSHAGYPLYLVTSGNELTQRQKVALLRIEAFFRKVYYVDPSRGETKQNAFRQIMEREPGEAETFLSVGNRVDTDIAEAKELGWKTCWVRIGEYAHMGPRTKAETPDYEVSHIQDLVTVCRL